MSTSGTKRIFLSYHRVDGPASDVLAIALRGEGFEVFRDRDSLVPGIPWPEQLEQALVESDAIVVCVGPEGLGSWQKREIYLALDRQAYSDNFPVISLLLPGVDDPPLGFLRLETWIDLRQDINNPEALQKLARAVRGEPPLPEDTISAPQSTVCPYRGLELFREEDAPFFFGREDLVKQLADKTRQAPMTALLGPSGSGKSSLVQAGLLPALHKDDPTTHWHVMILRPGNDPLVALVNAFDPPPDNLGRTEQLAYLNNAAMHLRQGDVRLLQLAELLLASLPSTGRLLLVIDQWEELYTQASRNNSEEDVARFVTLIFEASQIERFHGILVLRTDFYEEASRYPGMPQFLANHQVPVEGIQRKGLERAITEPAAGVGLRLEDGLLERLLDDIGDEPGNLPLLEHALHQLWLQRREGLLTFDAYRTIGGVQGAIAERARQAYCALRPSEQNAARRLLVSLVTPGESGKDTRARIPLPADVHEREVVRRFAAVENRLLVTGRDPYGRATVEVSHEALIRNWNELRKWVGESRALLQIRQRIKADMMHWETNKRQKSLLLPRGIRLEEARKLLSHSQQIVIDDLHPYIRASLRRDVQRRWAGYAVAGIFLGITSFSAVYFYNLQLRETEARATAEQAQTQAETELRRAIETDGRRLAQIARRYLESGQPHRAIMVAREAFGPLKESLPEQERPYVWQAADVLHQAMATRPILRKVFRGHTWVVNIAAFSPDGKHIASAGVDGRVYILDARTLAAVRLIIPNPETFRENVFSPMTENVLWVTFSPDGEQLATANTDGSVRIFTVRDGKEMLRFQAHPGAILSLSFTPDGSALLTTSINHLNASQARLWNAADGTLIRSIIDKGDCCVSEGVVSPDGRRAAIVEGRDGVSVRDLESGERLLNLGGGESFPLIYSVAFSPDGAYVATGDSDGLVRIWDTRSGTESLTLRGHESRVGSVNFSSDGRYLVTTDAGPTAQALIWDVKSGQRLTSLLGHDVEEFGLRGILSATFSPDSRFIVTTAGNRTVRLWEFAHPDSARLLRDKGRARRFTFSPDGTLIAASSEGAALVWQPGKEKAVRLGDFSGTVESSVSFSPDSSRLLVPSDVFKSEAYLYDTKTFEQMLTFSPVSGTKVAADARFSPDGSKLLADVSYEGLASFSWDLMSRELTTSDNGFARIWDTDSGKELALLGPHPNFHDLAFVGSGGRVMTAGGSFIRFWNAANGAPLVEIRVREGEAGMVQAALSPDGALVATGSAWIRAAVWDTHTGKLITDLKGARKETDVQRFTPDGRYVVTTDDIGIIGFWDPRRGELIRTIHGPEAGIVSFDLSASGQRLLIGGKDLTLRAWDVEKGSLLFFTDLVPYLTPDVKAKFGVPPAYGFIDTAVLHPSGAQTLVNASTMNLKFVGRVFDLPYKNFKEVIEAAYVAVPYKFTADERTELELDIFGRPDPRIADFEYLTVDAQD
ncbi:MAG TPA: TIR domain-containing protein [Woeseiaceae bacterium]|nr:TIR domain-containing protein [Woeseiaceae bacterium]